LRRRCGKLSSTDVCKHTQKLLQEHGLPRGSSWSYAARLVCILCDGTRQRKWRVSMVREREVLFPLVLAKALPSLFPRSAHLPLTSCSNIFLARFMINELHLKANHVKLYCVLQNLKATCQSYHRHFPLYHRPV
jgi:hypothetical protein